MFCLLFTKHFGIVVSFDPGNNTGVSVADKLPYHKREFERQDKIKHKDHWNQTHTNSYRCVPLGKIKIFLSFKIKIFLSPNFLIHKMGMITASTSRVVVRIKWDDAWCMEAKGLESKMSLIFLQSATVCWRQKSEQAPQAQWAKRSNSSTQTHRSTVRFFFVKWQAFLQSPNRLFVHDGKFTSESPAFYLVKCLGQSHPMWGFVRF